MIITPPRVLGPLGGSSLERVHVQVPGLRESQPQTPGLPSASRHLRARGGPREGETSQGLPAEVCLTS